MNARIGLRLGSFAALIACAALVACGGGGGGGITPSGGATPTPTPVVTPTPGVTPTPVPSAQATASGTLSSVTSTSFSFGPVTASGAVAIQSASVTVPAVSSGNGSAFTSILTATSPMSASAPQIRMARTRNSTPLGIQSVLAYFQVTVTPAVTIADTPSFTATFPGTLNASDNYYLLLLDPTSKIATGWTSLGTATIQGGNTLAFGSQPLTSAIKLADQQTYYFALATTGTNAIQTPAPNATIASGPGSPIPSPTPRTNGGWLPAQIVSALNMPATNGWDGTGQTIAIVGDATPNPSDINTYLAAIGQTNRPGGALKTVYPVPGQTPDGSGNANGDDGEATLDVETVMGLAPGATVEFYAIPNLDTPSFWAAEQYIYTSDTAKIESLSFGGCEASSSTTDDTYFAAGLSHGVAYFASSGDQGNECYTGPNAQGNPTFTPGPNNPASDPNVVGVGGNENINAAQNALGSLTSTQVWNDTFLSGAGAGGGGVSTLFTSLPSYQQGLAGTSSKTARNVPDISMPSEGVAIFYTDPTTGASWKVFGGTSWSAPIAASLMAQLNEYCGNTAPSNPVAMWYTAATRSNTSYIDIVTGNNQFGTSKPFYSAAAGYDNASGLGLPMGTQVAAAMCPQRTWQFAGPVQSMARTSAYASYGEQRDTTLNNVPNLRRVSDLGSRSSLEETTVTLAMRNTPTANGDVQGVLHELRAAGFNATANGLLITATAPTATVNGYFRTSIHNLQQGRFGTRYANVTAVTLPAAIAPYVGAVSADNLILRRRMSHIIR